MTKNVSLRTQLAAFDEGNIMDADGTVNNCNNFFDWFCKDDSLENKARKLFPRVKTFAEKMGVNLDQTYCMFKNNCPSNGPLYDDFRICDRENGFVIWTVVPKCSHSGQAEVWGTINSFQEAHLQGPSLSQIYQNLPH